MTPETTDADDVPSSTALKASTGDVSPQTANGSQQARPVGEAISQNGNATAELQTVHSPLGPAKSPFAGQSLEERRSEDGGEGGDATEDERPRQCMTNPPQRMVSWQDQVQGQDLFTVREFEPSESGHATEADDTSWDAEERKSCCSVM